MGWDLKDMASGEEEKAYPFGLCIHLNADDLERLGLEADCEVGDFLHGMFFAKVTSLTHHGGGSRVELQITHLALEDESTETGEDDEGEGEGEDYR